MSTDPKRILFEQFALMAKALANGHRLEILELLAQGERCVEDLAERAGLEVANTSQHLQHLRRVGLVVARREGKKIFYEVFDQAAIELMVVLRRVAKRNLAEVERAISTYFLRLDGLEPVSREELRRKLTARTVTLIDVRPCEEFAAGHIRGAVNIPLKDLARRLRELPKNEEVVAYCRGPFCLMSFEAVDVLRQRGLTARRLEDGYPEWKLEGLPVESSAA
jgi:rhodanese-related sulfurtransferase/predicted transcriptional regulator